jgi:hypothetical protein
VARLEVWAKDGVGVVRLYDTVTNSLPDRIELGRRLLEEGLARPATEQLLALPPGAGPEVWDRLEELLQEQEELLGLAGPRADTEEQRTVLARLREMAGESRRLLGRAGLARGGQPKGRGGRGGGPPLGGEMGRVEVQANHSGRPSCFVET